MTAFALGPGVPEVLCVCPLKVKSISPSSLGTSKLSLSGLQSQMLWGLIFLVQDPQAGDSYMQLRTLTPGGEPLQYNHSPVWGSPIFLWLCWVLVAACGI